jgi:hypothetical protein
MKQASNKMHALITLAMIDGQSRPQLALYRADVTVV